MLSPDCIAALQSIVGPSYCIDESSPAISSYITPERGLPGHTPLVVRPADHAQLQAVLAACNQFRAPLVIRAGNTGLVEAQRPEGEIVLDLSRINRLLSLQDAAGHQVTFTTPDDITETEARITHWRRELEAGKDALDTETITLTAQTALSIYATNQVLEVIGRTIPIEMASHYTASLGACVANGTAAANAIRYGTAADQAVAAWGIWGNGEDTGETQKKSRNVPCNLIINSARFPYGGDTLIGTQGVLGIITRLTITTQHIPQERQAVLLAMDSYIAIEQLKQAVQQRFGEQLEQYELISAASMRQIRQHKEDIFARLFAMHPAPATLDAPYYVMIQLMGGSDLAEQLLIFLQETDILEQHIGYASDAGDVKSLRHFATEASNLATDAVKASPADEREHYRLALDIAMPLAKIDACMRDLYALRDIYPFLTIAEFGHIGVGALHVHLIRTDGEPLTAIKKELLNDVLQCLARHGATYSAEHGVGTKWAEAFIAYTPPEILQEMTAAMRAHDPHAILNPRAFGKVRLLSET